jgi:hypothetical protein
MKRSVCSVLGALLVAGLAAALSSPASAGGRYGYDGYGDGGCNCNGPVTRVVNAGTQVITHQRVVNTNRVVPSVHVVNHNRVVLHRRTIVNREIVLHRNNTEYRNITVNRINTAHKFQTVHRRQVVNRYVNTASHRHVSKTVQGTNCNCAPGQSGYRGEAYWRQQQRYAIRSRY